MKNSQRKHLPKTKEIHKGMDLRKEFIFESILEVQETNRFLDAKAGVLITIETTLLFVVVSNIFDSQKYAPIKATIQAMPQWLSTLILVYCIIYMTLLIFHILYSLRVLYPTKDPSVFVDTGSYKPRNIFFLKTGRNGKIAPSLKDYAKTVNSSTDDDIINELIFELMKLSYIRDMKSSRIQNSIRFLNVLIVGVVIFGFILVAAY